MPRVATRFSRHHATSLSKTFPIVRYFTGQRQAVFGYRGLLGDCYGLPGELDVVLATVAGCEGMAQCGLHVAETGCEGNDRGFRFPGPFSQRPFAGKAFVLGGQLDHAEMFTSLRESPVSRLLVGQGR